MFFSDKAVSEFADYRGKYGKNLLQKIEMIGNELSVVNLSVDVKSVKNLERIAK
jgi:hypothetical protein